MAFVGAFSYELSEWMFKNPSPEQPQEGEDAQDRRVSDASDGQKEDNKPRKKGKKPGYLMLFA